MKSYTLLLFIICLIPYQAISQNLVPNPSFEDTIQVNGQPGLDTWQDNIGTPDYFSDYFVAPFNNRRPSDNFRGGEAPKDGFATFGFAVLDQRSINAREYMQVKLLDSLTSGLEYEVEFYISLADSFHWALAANDIGIHFHSRVYPNNYDHKVREFRPYYTSDTAWNASNKNGWEKFHYTYTAQGGEISLVIGCFLNDQEISIDSVGNGGSFPFAYDGSFYYIDDISVRLKDSSTSISEADLQHQIYLYPNPTKANLTVRYSKSEQLQFVLYSLQGRKIAIVASKEGNNYKLNLAAVPKGIYLLQIANSKSQSTFKIMKQ